MDLMKDKSATQYCVERSPKYRAVKFSKDLIQGYECAKTGCGLFNTDCETCSWNTKTPYIIIDDTKVFVCRDRTRLSTGFNEEDAFYILIDEFNNSIKCIDEKTFNERYEFK